MISALAKVKSNIDSGIFQAIQRAAIGALERGLTHTQRMRRIYEARRDLLVTALQRSGWPVSPPKATFYLWAPVPRRSTSQKVASLLLTREALVATPGTGFGKCGEGYVRFSLSVPTHRLEEAARRIAHLPLWPPPSLV